MKDQIKLNAFELLTAHSAIESLKILMRTASGMLHPDESPQEFICGLFDDSGLDDLLAESANHQLYEASLDLELKKMSGLFGELPDYLTWDELQSHEKWTEIVHVASNCLAGLETVVGGNH